MIKKYEMRSIIITTLPLMAAFLAQRGMQFIDALMMGWIGPTALAAGALGTVIFATMVIFCMGILSAIGIFIVRAKSSGHSCEIKYIIQHGFCLAVFLSIPCMLIIWFIPPILLSLGQDPQVVVDTTLLLHGMIWGLPGLLLFLVLRELIAAFSLTFIVMVVSLFSIPLTFVANYVLVYGKYHFPQFGIAGIGYGGSIVMWFMFFSLLIYSRNQLRLKEHIVLNKFKLHSAQFKDMLHMGIPSGTLFLLEAGMFSSTALMMGYFGTAALAGHQIAFQCVNIAYTLPMALSMATALQIGHAAAAKNYEKVQQIALFSFSMTALTSGIIAIALVLSSGSLVNLFLEKGTSHFQQVHQLATSFINIAALFLCFDAAQTVANGALRGLRDTFVPMLLSIGCYWVLGIGSAYYLAMHTPLHAVGIWYGLTVGLCTAAILLILRFYNKLKIEKNIFMKITPPRSLHLYEK